MHLCELCFQALEVQSPYELYCLQWLEGYKEEGEAEIGLFMAASIKGTPRPRPCRCKDLILSQRKLSTLNFQDIFTANILSLLKQIMMISTQCYFKVALTN